MKNSIYHLQELPDHMDILLKCKIISNGWNTTLRQQDNMHMPSVSVHQHSQRGRSILTDRQRRSDRSSDLLEIQATSDRQE